MDQKFNCDRIEREEIVERYAAGTLPEDAAEAFEEHYFRCAACLARLEAVQEAGAVMRLPFRVPRLSYVGLAVAASLVVVVGGALVWKLAPSTHRQSPVAVARVEVPAQNPWAGFGKFDAPAYRENRLRGAGGASAQQFLSGMSAYQQGDYAQAASLLQKAAEADPRDARTQFFLGVSLILSGNPASGLKALRLVDAMGLSPYQEESRLYQAKALLQMGDADAARAVLQTVVALRGDWETEAKQLLAKLAK